MMKIEKIINSRTVNQCNAKLSKGHSIRRITTQILGVKGLSKWHASFAKLVFLVQTEYKQCDFKKMTIT